MAEYTLKMYNRNGRTKYFHNIVEITFYDKSIRVKDYDGAILTIDIRDLHTEIFPIETSEEE